MMPSASLLRQRQSMLGTQTRQQLVLLVAAADVSAGACVRLAAAGGFSHLTLSPLRPLLLLLLFAGCVTTPSTIIPLRRMLLLCGAAAALRTHVVVLLLLPLWLLQL